MKKFGIVISFILSFLFISGDIHAEEGLAKLEKVTISYLPISMALPLFLAVEEGVFIRHGIEAELVKFQAPNQIIDTLVANRADAAGPGAASGITIIASQKFPGSLKVFQLNGSLENEKISTQFALVVPNNSTVQSFKDLKGKSLGIFPGIQWRTFTKRILKKNGLNPETDVRLVEIPVQQHTTALLSGSVDATLSGQPIGAIAEASGQARTVEESSGTDYLANPFYPGASVLAVDFIKKRPKVAQALVDALDEAVEIIRKNPEEKKQILGKYLTMTPEQLKYLGVSEFVTSKELVSRKRVVDAKEIDPVSGYQKISDIFLEEGVLGGRVDVSELIYHSVSTEK